MEYGERDQVLQRVLESAALLQQLIPDAVLVGGSAPTIEESLRIKAYLIVQRNQVRDYLDVVALADRLGFDDAVEVLEHIDDYYVDRSGERASVVTALVLRLAKPAPLDTDVIDELPRYKGIVEQWQDWEDVVDACKRLALALAEGTS